MAMTTAEITAYYAKLLILQYRGKDKAFATIEAVVNPVVMDQLPLLVADAFNLDTAEGDQLDVLGKYIGLSRVALTFTGQVTLDDSDYRLMLKLKIVQNNAGSSLYEIQNQIHMFFESSLRVFDYKNMSMSYMFDSAFGSEQLAEVFVRQGLLPKPMGVQLGALVYAPDINNFFGMRTYEVPGANITGFNSYDDYQTNWPWLSYDDAVIL